MTQKMEVAAGEIGVARVFAVDLPDAAARDAFVAATDDHAVKDALGTSFLDIDYVEHFNLSDLGDMGLTEYLNEGWGIPMEQLDPMRSQLAAIDGSVLLVGSRAFGGFAKSLTIAPPLRHVATFVEEAPPVVFEDLPSEAAEPYSGTPAPARKPASDAAIMGRVATVALLVIFLITALVIWIA